MRQKKRLLLIGATVAFLVLAAAFVFADMDLNLKKVDSVKGTVVFRYGGGFFLKGDDGKEYKLMVGPYWYLDDLGLKLKTGDKVTVSGSVDEDMGVLLVSTLKKGAKTYRIADTEKVFESMPCHRFNERTGMGRGGYRGRMRMNGQNNNGRMYQGRIGQDND